MNISTTQYLFSSINHNKPDIDSDNLFYIGTGIGLASGVLIWCIIAYSKYQKKKMELESLPSKVTI